MIRNSISKKTFQTIHNTIWYRKSKNLKEFKNKLLIFPVKNPIFPFCEYRSYINKDFAEKLLKSNIQYVGAFPYISDEKPNVIPYDDINLDIFSEELN